MTRDTVREFASFRAAGGGALSLYLDLDPSTSPSPSNLETRINSLLTEAEREAERRGLEHDPRQALRQDLEGVRSWWDGEFERDGARGIAVFASSLDGLWRTLPLPLRVPDHVRVGPDLYLTPLLSLLADGDGALVALVGRERGQVFRLRDGRLEEVVDQFEDQPGQHEQGGWAQARYQRHLDKLVRDHLRSVGDELDRRSRSGAPEIVIVAPQELRSEIESALSSEAREAIVGWAVADARATPAELLELARPHLERAAAAQAAEALERWRFEAGTGGRAASGWTDTLEAAADGRVELLLVAPGANRAVYRCPACGRSAAAPGECPLDGRELEPEPEGLDLAVHAVLAHGGSIVAVEGDGLAGQDGIAALLRF